MDRWYVSRKEEEDLPVFETVSMHQYEDAKTTLRKQKLITVAGWSTGSMRQKEQKQKLESRNGTNNNCRHF